MTRKHFNYEFHHLPEVFHEDLRTLEQEGAVYAQFWRDDINDFGYCRIQFTPGEIVEFVQASKAFDEFTGNAAKLKDPKAALDAISNSRIRRRVEAYNEWARSRNLEQEYCFAAFLGGDLESLHCGGEPDRYEFLGNTYTGDRRFLLREILENFPAAVSAVVDRSGGRPPFEISSEQDIHDLLFAIVRSVFPDARTEEFTPSHGGSAKRIDIVIPKISTVIEAKYVRDKAHAKRVVDELRVDIESYHTHPACEKLIGVLWDPDRLIVDRVNVKKDLGGRREKSGSIFHVDVWIGP